MRRKNDKDEILFAIKHVEQSTNYNKIFTIDDSTKWGMGERFQERFHIADGWWTVYNRDRPWEIDSGSSFKSKQTYGHQPIYLARNRDTSLFHLIYFKNTYGFNIESK